MMVKRKLITGNFTKKLLPFLELDVVCGELKAVHLAKEGVGGHNLIRPTIILITLNHPIFLVRSRLFSSSPRLVGCYFHLLQHTQVWFFLTRSHLGI